MRFSADVNPNIMDPAIVFDSTAGVATQSGPIDTREWQGVQATLTMLTGSPRTTAVFGWYLDNDALNIITATTIDRANSFFGGAVPMVFRLPVVSPVLRVAVSEVVTGGNPTSRLRVGRTDVPIYGCDATVVGGILLSARPTVLNGATFTQDLYPYYGPATFSVFLNGGGLGWTTYLEQESPVGSGTWVPFWQDFGLAAKAIAANVYIPAKHCRLRYVNAIGATETPAFAVIAAPQTL